MAGLISPATLEQVRLASDIVDVIGGYIPLKKAGANFVALCPFHREKTASFNVNAHRQIFHCFGCHKGGDVFRFVQEYENITFVEAVRRLAQRANIPLELQQSAGQKQVQHVKETLRQIHEQVTQRWQSALRTDAAGQVARDYLRKRGVTDDAVQLFRLGYASEAWDDTVNWARSKDYDLATVEQAGLIIRKDGTDRHYDRFRGRLIFPICDEQGRVIGFSGRLLADDVKAAKYVNSPETPIFTKGKVFFGLDKSKRALLDAECAIVCEGQLDLIRCFMGGVQNVVAPQGTALTPDHARLLKRYVAEVILCFDSDQAGQAAAARSFDSLLEGGLAVRVAVIPPPHDPDSFIKERGADAFRELIAKAEGYFDFLLNRLCALHDPTSDKGRLTVAREMAEAVQKTGSVVLIDTYAQKTALRLGISPEAARIEFKRVGARPQPAAYEGRTEDESVPTPPAARRPSPQEFGLVKLLLGDDIPMDWICRYLDPRWLLHDGARTLVQLRLEAYHNQSWDGVAALLNRGADEEMRRLITEAATEDKAVEDVERSLQEIVLRLRNQFLDRELSALKQRVSQPGLSGGDEESLLRQQGELRRLKQQPLQPRAESEIGEA